ncbi:hypothetical protein AB8B21_03070 [Tardiphaga sp. 866_E4_N2_1]
MSSVEATEPRPRVRMYPHHVDYSAMSMEFRPFAMFMHPPNYKSTAVNTDDLGLRVQYASGDKRLDWRTLKSDIDSCDVLVGNSSLFGVDCSSDKTTITHYLNENTAARDLPTVLNVGIRGATSQQELVIFQSLRRFMPKIRKIVIFSGVLGATSIALPNTYIHPDFGIMSEEAYNLDLLSKQYKAERFDRLDRALHKFHTWIDAKLRAHRRLERMVEFYFGEPVSEVARPEPDIETKFDTVMDLFTGDVGNWMALGRGLDADVHFVLQPVINWTTKPLTPAERTLFDLDLKAGYYLDRYATSEFHQKYRDRVKAICGDAGMPFHDANEWLNDSAVANQTVFVDVCHLTDFGNKFLADKLRTSILGA